MIKGPFSPKEKELGEHLLGYSNQLPIQLAKFECKFNGILISLIEKKTSAARYTNPYANDAAT